MKRFIGYYVLESIIDPERSTLDPQIFDNPNESNPRIKPAIIQLIQSGINRIQEKTSVIDYTIIGSILTKRYSDTSDVDINVLISSGDYNAVKDFAISISEKNIPSTKHPINFHVVDNRKDFNNANESADAVFDPKQNKFIRKASSKPFDLNQYWSDYKTVVDTIKDAKEDLKDDLIDYEQLKTIKREDLQAIKQKLETEIKEIEGDVHELEGIYDKIKKERRSAFEAPLTATEIYKYGSKNRLPQNVIYKLLEKHYYLQFIQKIEEIIGPDNKLSKSETDKLSNYVLKQS